MSFRIGAATAAATRMPFAAERKMADQIGPQPFSMQRCIHIDRRMHMQHLAARYRYAFRARAMGEETRRRRRIHFTRVVCVGMRYDAPVNYRHPLTKN